jgi:hypothetical protein
VKLSAVVVATFMDQVSGKAEPFFAVTSQNTLAVYDTDDPGTLIRSVILVPGLIVGESIAGIDLRPSTGELYATGTLGRLYKVNVLTGQLTPFGGPFPSLDGTNFGYGFDPVDDLIQIVSTADQNLLLNPNTNSVISVGADTAYAAGDPGVGINPSIMGAAYSNPAQGITTLYMLDSRRDVLVREDPPNSGMLHTIGALGVDFTELGGFYISTSTGSAFAALQPSSGASSLLYEINLVTGNATNLGEIGGGVLITAMSIPTPGAFALAIIGSVVVIIAIFGKRVLQRADKQLFGFAKSKLGNCVSSQRGEFVC